MISETEYDDVELSEVEIVSEELELPDELSLLAHEIKNRLKQQNNKMILNIFFQTACATLSVRNETKKQKISENVHRIPASRKA